MATWMSGFGVQVMCLVVLFAGCSAQDEGEDDQSATEDGVDRFPCGNGGGTCELDTEMCLVDDSDGCTICSPLPTACDPQRACGCLPAADDPAFGLSGCVDAGMCELVEGGLVVTCTEASNWGCG